DDAPKILNQLRGLTVRWIACTHAHPGHTGAKETVKTATEAPTAMHLADATAQLKSADRYLTAGDTLPFGGFELQVLATPGHTPGGLCFKVGNHVFTGDTLLPADLAGLEPSADAVQPPRPVADLARQHGCLSGPWAEHHR